MVEEDLRQQLMDGKSFGLLLLPIKVRIQIYRYCGLIRPCPIDLHIESIRQRWATHDRATRVINCYNPQYCEYPVLRTTDRQIVKNPDALWGLECFCQSLPHQLLRVSRAMHLEAETVLYGMNQFKVSRHLPGDNLGVIRALNARVWSLLSSLHISISEVPPLIYGTIQRGHETIDAQDVAGHQTLQRWAAVSRDILSNVRAHWLRLSLSCDVKDIRTAREIVAPLDRLPPMSEVSICLAADPKRREIQEVAREAISRLRQRKTQREPKSAVPRLSSLSWISLPKEVRLDILSRTDLVDYYFLDTPPQRYNSRRHGFELKAGTLLPRGGNCCYNCTPTLSTCACAPVHAAFSPSCTCATIPTAVFSVSKDMNAEATITFFSRNRFILSGDFAATTLFIQSKLARNVTAISCIRRLDLQISYLQLLDMGNPNSRTAKDWAALVACVASFLHLPKLWLSVDAGQFRDELDDWNNYNDQGSTWMRPAYSALFAPLYIHLSGERRPEKFHVFLCWWTEEEEKAEKAVMGGDYNSVAEGKIVWRERHWRYPHSVERSKGMMRYRTNLP